MIRAVMLLFAVLISSVELLSQSASHPGINRIVVEMDKFRAREFPPDSIQSSKPFGSFSESDLARRQQFYLLQQKRLDAIKPSGLSRADLINLELLKYLVKGQLNYYEFREYLNPVLSDHGFHTSLPFLAGRRYGTIAEMRSYINKLNAFPLYAREQMELIRKGLALGISQPQVALAGYESTYDSHILDTVERSIFWQPFSTRPAHIPEADWNQLNEDGRRAVERVITAYRDIKTFFEKEYYVLARKTLGVHSFPNGKHYYDALVKYHTTTDLTPEQVYETGMREVERINKEMEEVLREVSFTGSMKDFIQYLRTDQKFYATTPEQLLKEASYIAKKIDGKLPALFGKLPRQPYGVEPVPAFLAPSYTAGRYSGAPLDSRNAGMYWVNTHNLGSRSLYTLESLTLHEAVPGHHLQVALAKELSGLPSFRRNFYVNAFGEGWGLYSEYLGHELGLYTDPYSRFGRLTYEMWRACRLVIDVGIHAKEWSREKAVDFLAAHTALSLHEVNTEVNRYITWPGQALAYKIGEIRIRELRKKAEDTLKEKFDIRAFHDLVLSQGSVTLSVLEMMVDRFIETELKKNTGRSAP